MKKNNISIKILFIVTLLYTVLVFLTNYSLLLGDNLMKWDIMESHYPCSMFLSNSLQSGILPLWNPIMNYGTPYYAILGMPIWYPTTVLFALFGYSIRMVGVEYCLHIVIACVGMFLFVHYSLENKRDKKNGLVLSFLAGMFYGFSTLFLSNAQHIMFIISAAWLPLILYFIRKYLIEDKIIYLAIAGLFSGISILGGYPEIWVAMFLILIPFFAYYYEKKGKVLRRILDAAWRYLLFCIFTICASAVSLVPFALVLGNVARMSDGGVVVNSYSPIYLLSMIIPQFWTYIQHTPTIIDQSMISFYMGIFTIITIPVIAISLKKKQLFNTGIIIFSFLMLLGNNSFLHPIFYKFFPGFSTLRFPAIWRCVIAVFLLEMVANFWNENWENANALSRSAKTCKWIGSLLVMGAIIIEMLDILNIVKETLNLTQGILIAGIIVLAYGVVLNANKQGTINEKVILGLLISVAIVDIASYYTQEAPMTITRYDSRNVLQDQNVKGDIKRKYEESKIRNRSVEYKNAVRSSGQNGTQDTVLQGTLAEEGYLSIKLQNVENYKISTNRFITQGNPVAYITDDVVSESEMPLQEWKNDMGIPNTQIYIEKPEHKVDNTRLQTIGNTENISRVPLEKQIFENKTSYHGNIGKLEDGTLCRKIVLKVNEIKSETMHLSFDLINQNGQIQEFREVEYTIQRDDSIQYIDIYLPSFEAYQTIVIYNKTDEFMIEDAEYVIGKRMNKAQNVKFNSLIPNYVELKTDATTEGYLVLLQAYYKGWNAYVDEQPVAIEKVNDVFMGVYLEPGNHIVKFRFVPKDFYIGLIISILYFAFMIFLLIRQFIHSMNRKNQFPNKRENNNVEK